MLITYVISTFPNFPIQKQPKQNYPDFAEKKASTLALFLYKSENKYQAVFYRY